MARMNMSLCELPFEMHNISNLSGICDPSAPPSGGLPHSIMTIIQIFYGLICLLGLIGIILHSKEICNSFIYSFHNNYRVESQQKKILHLFDDLASSYFPILMSRQPVKNLLEKVHFQIFS